MRRLTQKKPLLILAAILVFLLLTAGSCGGGDGSSATQKEGNRRDNSYNSLTAAQPAHSMNYSPTRNTINAWIDTWNQKGQLDFTYILNQNGEKVGYYVFLGPPVSMCAALTPTYKFVNPSNGDSNGPDVTVPAPGVDGAYYSGGQCIQYYGIDAKTKQLIGFTVGGALNEVDSSQPLYLDVPGLKALGNTSISDLKQVNGKYVLP